MKKWGNNCHKWDKYSPPTSWSGTYKKNKNTKSRDGGMGQWGKFCPVFRKSQEKRQGQSQRLCQIRGKNCPIAPSLQQCSSLIVLLVVPQTFM